MSLAIRPRANRASPSTTPSPTPFRPASATPEAEGDEWSPCELLAAFEARWIAGLSVEPGEPAEVAGNPACRWEARNGAIVQVIGADASAWAQLLPEIIDGLKRVRIGSQTHLRARIRKAVRIIEDGGNIAPERACELFSSLAELQGGRPESTQVISIFPRPEQPQSISAQTCSDGVFTSLLVADGRGLAYQPRLSLMRSTAKLVHDRYLSAQG